MGNCLVGIHTGNLKNFLINNSSSDEDTAYVAEQMRLHKNARIQVTPFITYRTPSTGLAKYRSVQNTCTCTVDLETFMLGNFRMINFRAEKFS